jgi:hypothetical protein
MQRRTQAYLRGVVTGLELTTPPGVAFDATMRCIKLQHENQLLLDLLVLLFEAPPCGRGVSLPFLELPQHVAERAVVHPGVLGNFPWPQISR